MGIGQYQSCSPPHPHTLCRAGEMVGEIEVGVVAGCVGGEA
jgi:hypothetical protein